MATTTTVERTTSTGIAATVERWSTGLSLQRLSVPDIDAKTAASTGGATTENNGKRFVVTGVVVECTAATAITLAGALSVGTNSSSYNNILAITTLTGITAVNLSLYVPLPAAVASIAPNTQLFTKITTPATGTSQVISAHVVGFYQL